MKVKRHKGLWLFLLPLLVPLLLFIFQRLNFSSQIIYLGVVTSLSGEKFNPDAGLKFSMEWMSDRLQWSAQPDLIEMRWADGMAISYSRKTRELRYGFINKPPRWVAYDVTPTDIKDAAKLGGSFKNFKRYRFYGSDKHE